MSRLPFLRIAVLALIVGLVACAPNLATSPLSMPVSPLLTLTPLPSPTWTPTVKPSPTPTETPMPTPTETPVPTPVPLYTNGVWECWDRGQSVPCPYDASLSLKQMAFVSDTEAWAVGGNGYIAHWDGYTWTRVESPTDKDLNDVSFLSPDNGWAVGEDGLILHWDGNMWSVVREEQPLSQFVGAPRWNAVAFAGSDYGWVVGSTSTEGGSTASAMYWDGIGWKEPPTPPIFCDHCFLWDVTAFGSQDVWIVGGNEGGLVLHWDGTNWYQVPNPFSQLDFGRCWLYSISAISNNDIWISGTFLGGAGVDDKGVVIHWNGTEWMDMQLAETGWTYSILMLSENNGWVGGDALFHWNGQIWEKATNPAIDRIVDIESGPNGEIWALTQQGAFLHLSSK